MNSIAQSLSFAVLLLLPIKGCEFFQKEASNTVEIPLVLEQSLHSCSMPCELTSPVDLNTEAGYPELKAHAASVALSEVHLQLRHYSGIPRADAVLFSVISLKLRFDPSYGDSTTYRIGEFDNVYASDLLEKEKGITIVNPALTAALHKLPERPRFTVLTQYATVGNCAISALDASVRMSFVLNSTHDY